MTKNRDLNILKNYNREINLNTRVNDSNDTHLDYNNIKNLKRELELETLDYIDELNEFKDIKYKIDDTDTIDFSIIYDLYK